MKNCEIINYGFVQRLLWEFNLHRKSIIDSESLPNATHRAIITAWVTRMIQSRWISCQQSFLETNHSLASHYPNCWIRQSSEKKALQQCLGLIRPEPQKTKCFSNYFLCTQNAETHWANKVLSKKIGFKISHKNEANTSKRRSGKARNSFYLIFILLRTFVLLVSALLKKNCCKFRVLSINLNEYKRTSKRTKKCSFFGSKILLVQRRQTRWLDQLSVFTMNRNWFR